MSPVKSSQRDFSENPYLQEFEELQEMNRDSEEILSEHLVVDSSRYQQEASVTTTRRPRPASEKLFNEWLKHGRDRGWVEQLAERGHLSPTKVSQSSVKAEPVKDIENMDEGSLPIKGFPIRSSSPIPDSPASKAFKMLDNGIPNSPVKMHNNAIDPASPVQTVIKPKKEASWVAHDPLSPVRTVIKPKRSASWVAHDPVSPVRTVIKPKKGASGASHNPVSPVQTIIKR